MTRARFIAFEGGEGAGKSTQIARLADRLRAAGIDVLVTREPGGTPGAEEIRGLLVNGAADRWGQEAETLLMNAARADHVARAIRPALARGQWVLCDRYVGSTLAYQGGGKGIDARALKALHRFATGDLWPDCTLILDIDVETGLARAAARHSGGARFESHGVAFHEKVRAAFHALAAEDPQHIHLIDTRADVETVSSQIWATVAPLIDG